MNKYLPYELMKDVAGLLHSNRWIYAKTMPKHPHFYTLRKEWTSGFTEVAAVIRDHGYPEMFYKKQFIRFDINDMKYWTMGAPLQETILINRAVIQRPHPYDKIAPKYDDLFQDPESLEENEIVKDMLRKQMCGKILEVGCGTGVFSDFDDYTGIDPSQEMLNRCKCKPLCINTNFESFYSPDNFDSLFALFGTASYISPEYIKKIPEVAKNYFVMFYHPNYIPETHKQTGVPVRYFKDNHERLPGFKTTWKNYIIVRS